jgi:hypothetical protein
MKIKEGVVLAGLQPEMRSVLIAAESIWDGHHKELVVTCGLDGTHSAGSMHYYGYALDLRTNYFTEREQFSVSEALEKALGENYYVLLHSTHIHVHYRAQHQPGNRFI